MIIVKWKIHYKKTKKKKTVQGKNKVQKYWKGGEVQQCHTERINKDILVCSVVCVCVAHWFSFKTDFLICTAEIKRCKKICVVIINY